MPELTVGSRTVHLGPAGGALAALGIVWLTNLYNFMDGIDGIAAAEAVVVGMGGALLVAGRSPPLALVSVVVAAAAAGFLVWNWPPARLFMGDVGSGFLGFVFGGLALGSERAHALPAVLWLVLLGPFFLDATVTLVRRVARGERWYAAHRSHAYQRAVQGGWSHGRVAASVAGLSLVTVAAGWLAVRRPELLGLVIVSTTAGLGALYVGVERWRRMARPGGQRDRENESL
jgi:Fuc2NAc and GlcNAc transferase